MSLNGVRSWNVLLLAALGVAAIAACSASTGNGKPSGGNSGGSGGVSSGGSSGSGGGIGGSAGQGGNPNNNPTTVVIGAGADQSSPGKFGGATDATAAPQLVYPATGIIVPPNMNSLEFHFIPGAGQTLFEFRFEASTLNFVVYTTCTPLNNGCVFTPDQQFWGQLVEASRGAQPVKYTLRGVNGGTPGAVGVSETHAISFAKEDLDGGLYYWNAGGGAVMRYDFGFPGKTAELYLNSVIAGGGLCVGCHVLSRDGTHMAVGRNIPGLQYSVFDVATRTPTKASNGVVIAGGASFFAFSPDSSQFLFSGGAKTQWMDLASGVVKNANLIAATMPDWSPSGDQVVFAKGQGDPTGVASGSLQLLHYDASNNLWNNQKELVAFSGQNNYYPAFDPSGNWVLFSRSPGNHHSYENMGATGDGELWMVNAKTGGAPIRLDAATDPGSTSWPKFAPDLDTYYGGSVVWITFSSERSYGLRLGENAGVQLWMTAIDLDKAAAGQDPSFPAFWLPFQDIQSGNHIAQWVTSVARKPCTKNTDCTGTETCSNGKCMPQIH